MPVYTTSGDLVLTALKLMGIEEAGETGTAEDLNDGLMFLNLLLDEWSIDRSKIYARVEDTFTLVVGDGLYTMGTDPAGVLIPDISTVTPISIEQGFLRNTTLTPALDYKLNVTMLQGEYNDMPIKAIQTIPTRIFALKTWPLWSLYFDYLPNLAYEMHLFSWKPLTKIADINTALQLPDGYESALTYNLAVAFAPAFGKEASQSVVARAVKLAGDISTKNYEIPRMKLQGVPGTSTKSRGSIYNPFMR